MTTRREDRDAMTRDELIAALTDLADNGVPYQLGAAFGGRITQDTETAHIKADQLLIDYINDDEIATIFDRIAKWYA